MRLRFRTNAFCGFLEGRGVNQFNITAFRLGSSRYQRYASKEASSVFMTAFKFLALSEVNIRDSKIAPRLVGPDMMLYTGPIYATLELASGLRDWTRHAENMNELDQVFPRLSTRITSKELNSIFHRYKTSHSDYSSDLQGFPFPPITPEMISYYHGQIKALHEAALHGDSIEPFHNISGAILAYNLLRDYKHEYEGREIDAPLAALAILCHTVRNNALIPQNKFILALKGADLPDEFKLSDMGWETRKGGHRTFFDPSIPWEARRAILIDQRDPDEVEAHPPEGFSGTWMDSLGYSYIKIFANLSNQKYGLPKAAIELLSGKEGLFHSALQTTFEDIRRFEEPDRFGQISRFLIKIIETALGNEQYEQAERLLLKAKERTIAEFNGQREQDDQRIKKYQDEIDAINTRRNAGY